MLVDLCAPQNSWWTSTWPQSSPILSKATKAKFKRHNTRKQTHENLWPIWTPIMLSYFYFQHIHPIYINLPYLCKFWRLNGFLYFVPNISFKVLELCFSEIFNVQLLDTQYELCWLKHPTSIDHSLLGDIKSAPAKHQDYLS